MTSLLITGYKSFELGIFKDKDPKVNIIKKAIKRDLKRFLDEGVDWMIFTGNLGFEFWALEVAKELQKDYPLKLATLFPFETHGQNWSEANQEKYSPNIIVFTALLFSTISYFDSSYSNMAFPSDEGYKGIWSLPSVESDSDL